MAEQSWVQCFDHAADPYHGCVSDADDCIDVVREFCYQTSTTYSVTRCTKNFGQFSLVDDHSVRFKDEGKVAHQCEIPANGAPFIIVGLKLMECHQGPQHRTKKSKDTSHSTTEHGYSLASSRKRLTGTKKKGCPAAIVMREVIHFDEYKVPSDTRYWREVKSMELRNDLHSMCYEQVEQRKVIYIDLPKDHKNHILGLAADLKSPIDERILKKIRVLVGEGVYSPKEMHRHLKIFVKDIFRDREMPRVINRRFYPSKDDLRKIIYRQRRKTVHSLIDQEDLAEKIRVWREEHPDDKWTFRKSSFVKRPIREDDYEEEDGCLMVNEEQSLLVIYQSSWQRRLLSRYGKELVYLDATYRTTKYALPLFFLCVQTNDGFCVVGAFITEKEDSNSVAEALQVIKDDNPNWTCRGFMIDSSEVEANAIHMVFPESNIFICDFHRKQAWHRWLIASKHDVTSQDQTSELLNAVAESFTEAEFNKNLNQLHESEVWKSQPKLRQYINGQWLANDKHKMWVWAYRGNELTLVVNTNNGVEAQNKVFKYEYLTSLPMKTVSNLMTLLVEDFFVDSYRKYLQSNVTMSAGWREPSVFIPKELHHRPRYFVQHIREATKRCSDITPSMVTMLTDTEFLVQSANRVSHVYRVNLGDESSHNMPSCECREFMKTHLPCKHFCALMCHFADTITWNSLPGFYLNNPHFITDEDCVNLSEFQVMPQADESNITSASCNTGDDKLDPMLPHRSSLEESAKQVRELLQYIRNLSYIADSVEVMEEAKKQLSAIADTMKHRCPSSGTLLLEQPAKKPTPAKIISKKRKSPSIQTSLKQLPTRVKRRRMIKHKFQNISASDGKDFVTDAEEHLEKNNSRRRKIKPQKYSTSRFEVLQRIQVMIKDMSKEMWIEVLEKAKQTSGISFDNVDRTALAVLDECCDEEEHDNFLHEISDLAPAGLNMYAKLQLSVLLLCLLVKEGRFDLKRNLQKESEEAATAFRAMIESLKAIDNLKSGKPVPIVPDLPAPVSCAQTSTRLKLKKGKRVRFNLPEPVSADQKDYTLENIISVDGHQMQNIALKKNRRYYVCGEVLDMKDFHTLKNPKWLNDKVINAYLALLQREQNVNNTDHIFAMPSYMAVLWGQGKIDHWLYSDVKFAMFKWIFLPANVSGNHWVLLVANIQKATVSVLDSMGGNNQTLIDNWKSYMIIRSEKTGELSNRKWQTGDLVSSKQKDGNACGSFVLLNALVLSKNLDLRDVSHPLSLCMREYVRCKLLSASEEPPSQRSRCDMIGCTCPKRARWVACNVCGRWSHLTCVGLVEAPKGDYICPICVAQYQ